MIRIRVTRAICRVSGTHVLYTTCAPAESTQPAQEAQQQACAEERPRGRCANDECAHRREEHLHARAEDGDLLRGSDEHTRVATARAVGLFVRALHRAGFRDRNLDLRNLIVDGDRVTKIDSPRHRLVEPGDHDDALRRADWDRLLPQLAAFGVERAAYEAR